MDINELIQQNLIWIVPVITIALTLISKLIYKKGALTTEYWVDLGFSLSLSSFLLLVINLVDLIGSMLLLGYIILIFGLALFINRQLWENPKKYKNAISILLSFILGAITLYVTVQYIGGNLNGLELSTQIQNHTIY